MGVLRVGSLNVNGFRDRVKQSLFSELLSLKQLHVCFLQETHSTDDMAADYGLWWKGDCFLSHGTNLSLGVAVLLAPSLKAAILSKSEVVPGCLLMVRASVFEHTFTFINVYAPNRGPDRVDFFSRLDQILQSVSSGETVVMGGDWNCTLDFVHDRNGEEPHPQSAAALGSIVSGFNLIDVWREKHPQVKQYTRVRVSEGRVSAARLDRFYVSCSVRHRTGSSYKTRCFVRVFKVFWHEWASRKGEFETLIQWWEVGKSQIRTFCQDFTSYSTATLRTAIQALELDIARIHDLLINQSASGLQMDLASKQKELAAILHEKAKGAFVRSRYLSMNDMDAPTVFFFDLEWSTAGHQALVSLRQVDGSVTMDPVELRGWLWIFILLCLRLKLWIPLVVKRCPQVFFSWTSWLGTEDVEIKNWEGLVEKVRARLSKHGSSLSFSRKQLTPAYWVFEEPLFFNPALPTVSQVSGTLRVSLLEAGVSKVCHLRRGFDWVTAEQLANLAGLRSVRLASQVLDHVRSGLSASALDFLEATPVEDHHSGLAASPELVVTVERDGWEEGQGKLLSLEIPILGSFSGLSKRALYCVCTKTLNFQALKDLHDTKWAEVLGSGSSPKGSWRSLYKRPIEKRMGDLQWRLVHEI
ncbi:hypothetical protein NFI96_007832 [Prochilodus magdalenae]|nr:hypothetical protein NFI96_007832 [Prochilodus magdalenae]